MNDTPQWQGPYGEYDYIEQKKKLERRRRGGLIAAISVIVFLFVGVVSAFVWINRYSERPDAPPSSSQQSSGAQSQSPQPPSQSSQASSTPERLDDAPEVIITEGAAEPSLTVSEIYKKVSLQNSYRQGMGLYLGDIAAHDGEGSGRARFVEIRLPCIKIKLENING